MCLVLALAVGEAPHAIGQPTRTATVGGVDEALGTAAATLHGDSGAGAALRTLLHSIPVWHGWRHNGWRLLDEVRKKLCIV
jgi:hypothetical protein